MSETQSRGGIGRSILAVLAGVIIGIALTLGTDEVLHLVRVYPPWGASMAGYDWTLLLATAYRTIYGILGSYLTACLAPNRPMLHSMILGILGFAASLLGAVATWNGGPAFGPHWYPVALVVLAVPTAWAGAALYISRATLPKEIRTPS
jgi:hypothetical protein